MVWFWCCWLFLLLVGGVDGWLVVLVVSWCVSVREFVFFCFYLAV